jgi:hypothetical protein
VKIHSETFTPFLVSVRNCRIKTMPCVEKKVLLGTRPQGCHTRVQSGVAEMGSGFCRRGQTMGKGESLWCPIICDHQMEQVDMPGYNWKFLRGFASRENSQGNNQGSLASGHRSGGLVSVLALGPSTCPKNSRDLTVSIISLL